MKLLRLHINNFGKLSGYDLDFCGGVNPICEQNSYGKSTLAAFIRAMFYGLGRADNPDRMLKRPWQGGEYGGFLEFLDGKGVGYRIERIFKARESEDTFRLFRLSPLSESRDYSEKIGDELFGLDAGAFCRTAFMPQDTTVKIERSDSLMSKLTGLVEDSEDVGRYNKAEAALDKEIKKYGGKSGIIAGLERNITDIKLRQKRKDAATKAYEAYCREADAAWREVTAKEKELDALKQRLRDAEKVNTKRLTQNQLKRLTEAKKSAEAAFIAARGRFTGEVPGAAAFAAAESALRKYEDVRRELKTYNERCGAIRASRAGLPSKEETDAAAALISELTAAKTVRKSVRPAVLFAIPAAPALTGIILMIANFIIAGAVLLALGAAALAGVLIYLGGQKKKRGKGGAESADILEARIKDFFVSAGIKAEYPYMEEMGSLRAMQAQDGKLSAELSEIAVKKSEAETCAEALSRQLDGFFAAFRTESREERDKMTEAAGFCRDYDSAERSLTAAKRELDDFVLANAVGEDLLCQNLPENDGDLEREAKTLDRRISDLKNELAKVKRLAEAEFSVITDESDSESDLSAAANELQEAVRAQAVAKHALNFLRAAREKLSETYGDRLRDGYKKYCGLLGAAEIEAAGINNNTLGVMIEAESAYRSGDAFSAGLKDMISLCMRLALVDALFTFEKPFLVFDDPFVNYDDIKIGRAAELIKKLGEEFQIIYFCCHTSRKIV